MSDARTRSAAVLSIGREILRGRTLDTNAHFLAGRLTSLGAEVLRIAACDDDPDAIAREFAAALARGPRIVATTGGLGPTFDDRTLEGLSRALDRPLRLEPTALEWVRESYRDLAARGLVGSADLTPEREKMARLPEGARPVRNRIGAAPGVAIEAGGAILFCLPGVPDEMGVVWREEVEPEIARLLPRGLAPDHRDVELAIRDESGLAPILKDLLDAFPGVYAKSRVAGAKDSIRIVVSLSAEGGSGVALEEVEARLREEIRDAGLR